MNGGGFADGFADEGGATGQLRRGAWPLGALEGARDLDPGDVSVGVQDRGADGASVGRGASGPGRVPAQETAEPEAFQWDASERDVRAQGTAEPQAAEQGAFQQGVPEAGGESAARRIALDALSRAARTRGQLEALLQRKGIAPEAVAAVLDRFEEVGLIDDLDYAEAFVESRHRIRGQGGRALSVELRRRGVADDVVAEAIGGLDPDREFDTACRIARSRYERMSAVPPEARVRRLAGFLARKGYSGAVVARAVRYVVETADVSTRSFDERSAVEALDGMDEDGIMDGGIGDGGIMNGGVTDAGVA